MMRKLLFSLTMGVLLLGLNAHGAVIYVDTDVSGGDGTGWTTAYNDLQTAIDAASDDDEIWVAEGAYYPASQPTLINASETRYNHFALKNNVAVYGGFAGGETSLDERDITANETILSGDIGDPGDTSDNCYHVFYHPYAADIDDTAVLSGFTVTAGLANGSDPDDRGGGMYNQAASPTILNCVFSENFAVYGGGICNVAGLTPMAAYPSLPTLESCTFSENGANYGGGMYNEYLSSPTLTNCIFSDNQADVSGGGMLNASSSPTLSGCTFSGNETDTEGGGMRNVSSSPMLSDCTFSENNADCGGGMYNESSSSPILTNCTFSNNQADSEGGGMYNAAASPTLSGCVFSCNQASGEGGGMLNASSSSPSLSGCTFSGNQASIAGGISNSHSTLALDDCILWGNTATHSGDEIASTSSTTTFSYCDVLGSGGSSSWDNTLGTDSGNNIDADPEFLNDPDAGDDGTWGTDDDDYGDLHLTASSPCIDAGDPSATGDADIDGEPRIVDGDSDGTATIDIGADEFVDSDGDGLSDTDDDEAAANSAKSGGGGGGCFISSVFN